MKIPIACCLLVLMTGSVAEEAPTAPRAVSWDELKAPFVFEDPFEALTEEQLMDLATVARVRTLAARNQGKVVSEGMQKEADVALAKLAEQKIDVDGLFAKREEITRLRTQRASAVDPELGGVMLQLSGFVLPLEYVDKKVSEFL